MWPLQGELSQKFKVSGIPTLVLLDAGTGKLITADGRSVVMEDQEGKDFPWQPKQLSELVRGKLVNNAGEEKDFDADVKGTVFGLYFSAHWVGCLCVWPCESLCAMKHWRLPLHLISWSEQGLM